MIELINEETELMTRLLLENETEKTYWIGATSTLLLTKEILVDYEEASPILANTLKDYFNDPVANPITQWTSWAKILLDYSFNRIDWNFIARVFIDLAKKEIKDNEI